MKRPLRPEEAHVWRLVTATVRPAPGRSAPGVDETPGLLKTPPSVGAEPVVTKTPAVRTAPPHRSAPTDIERNRLRRIIRGRDRLEARLDLHGLSQDRARSVLGVFLLRAQDEGVRAVLVITGKGTGGDGVLKRRVPEWLSEPDLRPVVAGLSWADRRHGGEGALYVALKRK